MRIFVQRGPPSPLTSASPHGTMASATNAASSSVCTTARTPESFQALISKRACSCKHPRCGEVLRKYYFDQASPFPDLKKPQLLFEIKKTAPSHRATSIIRPVASRSTTGRPISFNFLTGTKFLLQSITFTVMSCPLMQMAAQEGEEPLLTTFCHRSL